MLSHEAMEDCTKDEENAIASSKQEYEIKAQTGQLGELLKYKVSLSHMLYREPFKATYLMELLSSTTQCEPKRTLQKR